MAVLLVAAAAFCASYARRPRRTSGVSYVLLVVAAAGMYAPYGPYFALDPGAPARRRGRHRPSGMINAFGGLGGFVGAYIVGALGGGTHSRCAFVFMAACLFASAVLMLFVRPARPTDRDAPVAAGAGRSQRVS